MESYVERWTREQREAEQKEAAQKEQKSRKRRKAVTEDVKNSRGEGQETQEESNGRE